MDPPVAVAHPHLGDLFNPHPQTGLLARELMRGEYIDTRESLLLIGNSATGEMHMATTLAFQAYSWGLPVHFMTVTDIVVRLLEQREQRQLERFHMQLAAQR